MPGTPWEDFGPTEAGEWSMPRRYPPGKRVDELAHRRRASGLVAELGFISAEIRTQHALLAGACAAKDRETMMNLCDDLIARHRSWYETYVQFLIANCA